MAWSRTCVRTQSPLWNCPSPAAPTFGIVHETWNILWLQMWWDEIDRCSATTTHLCWKDIAHWVAEIWVLVESLVFCVGAVVPQRFITVPGFTFCELSSKMLIFCPTMQISCPRRDRWNIFGRQEAESLQARLENRRLNRCNVFQLGQNLDHVQSRRLDKKVIVFESMKRGSDWHLLIWYSIKRPTCDKVDKVPGVVMEDGLEVLDELLDNRLHHHPVVVTALHTDHHLVENEILIKKWRKTKAVLNYSQLTGALPSRPKFPMRPPSRKNQTWWRGRIWIHFGHKNVILLDCWTQLLCTLYGR